MTADKRYSYTELIRRCRFLSQSCMSVFSHSTQLSIQSFVHMKKWRPFCHDVSSTSACGSCESSSVPTSIFLISPRCHVLDRYNSTLGPSSTLCLLTKPLIVSFLTESPIGSVICAHITPSYTYRCVCFQIVEFSRFHSVHTLCVQIKPDHCPSESAYSFSRMRLRDSMGWRVDKLHANVPFVGCDQTSPNMDYTIVNGHVTRTEGLVTWACLLGHHHQPTDECDPPVQWITII